MWGWPGNTWPCCIDDVWYGWLSRLWCPTCAYVGSGWFHVHLTVSDRSARFHRPDQHSGSFSHPHPFHSAHSHPPVHMGHAVVLVTSSCHCQTWNMKSASFLALMLIHPSTSPTKRRVPVGLHVGYKPYPHLELKSSITTTNIYCVTSKYYQHISTLLENPKKHDELIIVCKKVLKSFPHQLTCSHFIFLDQTAVNCYRVEAFITKEMVM